MTTQSSAIAGDTPENMASAGAASNRQLVMPLSLPFACACACDPRVRQFHGLPGTPGFCLCAHDKCYATAPKHHLGLLRRRLINFYTWKETTKTAPQILKECIDRDVQNTRFFLFRSRVGREAQLSTCELHLCTLETCVTQTVQIDLA